MPSKNHPIKAYHKRNYRASARPVAHSTNERPWLLWTTVAALLFVGIGALPAGYGLIADPSGRGLGFPDEMLASPLFPDYLVPGLFLFFVNGMGSLLAAAALIFRPQWMSLQRINPVRQQEWTWTFALIMGIVLIMWIVVQLASVTLTSLLQPLIALLGAWIVGSLLTPTLRHFYAAHGHTA